MAKYYSSTFGKISGKHGTAVAVIMKDGSTYLREYRKPSNPRTDKQQAHRAKFALSSKALVPFNPIFKETMGVTSGISLARSHTFKNAIVGEYPTLSMDYKKLMFSFGTLERLENASCSINEGGVSLKWDFIKAYNSNKNDSVNIVVFNKNSNQSVHLKDVALRSDKECNVGIPEAWTNNELYLWAYVACGDKKSDSVFVERLHGNHGSECDFVDVGQSVYTEDNKGIMSSVYCVVNQAIEFLIMMIYKVLGLFKQVMTDSVFQLPLGILTCTFFTQIQYVEVSYKYRDMVRSLKSSRRWGFDGLYGKYQMQPFS